MHAAAPPEASVTEPPDAAPVMPRIPADGLMLPLHGRVGRLVPLLLAAPLRDGGLGDVFSLNILLLRDHPRSRGLRLA